MAAREGSAGAAWGNGSIGFGSLTDGAHLRSSGRSTMIRVEEEAFVTPDRSSPIGGLGLGTLGWGLRLGGVRSRDSPSRSVTEVPLNGVYGFRRSEPAVFEQGYAVQVVQASSEAYVSLKPLLKQFQAASAIQQQLLQRRLRRAERSGADKRFRREITLNSG